MDSFLFLVQSAGRQAMPGRLLVAGSGQGEGFQPGTDDFRSDAQCPGGAAGGQDVLDLEVVTPAVGQRNVLQADDRGFVLAAGQNDLAVANERRFLALRPVFDEPGRSGSTAKKITSPSQSGAMSTSIGCLALRTAAPAGSTRSTCVRRTVNTCSGVSM
jgi:hypothetical protein